jgi:hypothetical protein
MNNRSAIVAAAALACSFLLVGSALAQGGRVGYSGKPCGCNGSRAHLRPRRSLQLEVTRFNLGIDPAPHQNKTLIIRVRHWDDDVKEYSYPERSTVNLELDPENRGERHEEHAREERGGEEHDRDNRREESYEHRERGLRILRAYYGAEEQFINVTEALRSRIDDGRLYLRVDNYSMGSDPLPGARKWLRILYSYEGERRNVTVPEKTELQLP